MKRWLLIACALGACRVSPPVASEADAQRSSVQLAELRQGRSLMVTKCGNCHAPPMPHDHLPAQWPAALDEMARRANLDPRQRFLIEQYFVVMAQ